VTVRWSPLAIDRVVEIAEWIAADHPAAADRIVDGLFDAAERLVDFPLSGREIPEFERPELREIIWEQYRIVYRIRGEHIDILTVRHTLQLLSESVLTS
jgi:plasmid stabilization system protein ParE